MKSISFDYTEHLEELLPLFEQLRQKAEYSDLDFQKLLTKHTKKNGHLFSKSELNIAYENLAAKYNWQSDGKLLKLFQRKPTRSISGVTPVTVLTKPFPCPGKCIFCPNDIRMPKSYLADEPGAQRAERNSFDPYLQTFNRLLAFQNNGHPVAKVEIIVLGGTWSYYPEPYQIWFIKECFRAMNDFSGGRDDRYRITELYTQFHQKLALVQQARHKKGVVGSTDPVAIESELKPFEIDGSTLEATYNHTVSDLYVAPERLAGIDQYQTASWEELEKEQLLNETNGCRNVGLVIETRPDNISPAEVRRIRRLGCTKTQIGIQSLNDDVLVKNKRGHDVAATRRAFRLLRQAGFKIHAHWMPNLYGSTVENDKQDFLKLFADPDFGPDELKIYPCSLINSAELMQYFQKGLWQPYTEEELLDVLTFCFINTPGYCRLTRVIRDIPSTDIVVGNKKTNFREIAERRMAKANQHSQDIRAREIRNLTVTRDQLHLEQITYQTQVSEEVFLQYVTAQNQIAGFLRLSFPLKPINEVCEELNKAAIIREVHVYGQSLDLGDKQHGRAQHLGLGTALLDEAKKLSREHGKQKLSVISAIGTRPYYRGRGFQDGQLYQHCSL